MSLNQVKPEQCNAGMFLHGTYEQLDDIPNHFANVTHKLLRNCRFGNILEISDKRLCFTYCTMGGNCAAVDTFNGCQMCYLDRLLNDQIRFDSSSTHISIRIEIRGEY